MPVAGVFDSVAKRYDQMNDYMSFGVHRLWKDQFVQNLNPSCLLYRKNNQDQQISILDVAGGTGDIAFRMLQNMEAHSSEDGPSYDISVLDINPKMLQVGKKRAQKRGLADKLTFIEGNAENLEQIPSSSIDLYTIAFGIRNCTHIDAVLREAYRVLKPGGVFSCLEFGKVSNPLVKSVYSNYSFSLIPLIGQIVAADRDSYQYLVESIEKFPPQAQFAKLIRDAGFENSVGKGWEDLSMGIAAIHTAVKPV